MLVYSGNPPYRSFPKLPPLRNLKPRDFSAAQRDEENKQVLVTWIIHGIIAHKICNKSAMIVQFVQGSIMKKSGIILLDLPANAAMNAQSKIQG